MSRKPDWTSRDPLGAALHFMRMSGAFYCRSELTAPWGLSMPAMEGCLWFHAVLSGSCVLEGRGLRRTALSAGDFVLIADGRGHVACTDRGVAAPDVTELPQQMEGERFALLRYGGGGAPSTIICGLVRFDHPAAHDLVEMMPRLLHLPPNERMSGTLALIAAEAKQLQPGGETVVTRLADVLVIQALRCWLAQPEAPSTGWLAALRDAQLGRALAQLHREPQKDWSVASLARASAMSRSAFAERFHALVGEPPMKYLARHRMRTAASLLREGGRTVSELAPQFGYRSEAAFSRAFKRVSGSSPGSHKPGS